MSSNKKETQKQPKSKDSTENRKNQFELQIGDKVKLSGLKTESLNGEIGVISCLPKKSEKEDSRFGVRMSNKAIKNSLGVKRENIEYLKNFKVGDKVTVSRPESTKKEIGEIKFIDQEAKTYSVQLINSTEAISFNVTELFPLRESETEIKSKIKFVDEKKPDGLSDLTLKMMNPSNISQEMQINLYGRVIKQLPNFYTEFIATHEIPQGVAKNVVRKYLNGAHAVSLNSPHQFEHWIKSASFEPSTKDVVKRLNSTDTKIINWWLNSNTMGDILKQNTTQPYTYAIRQSYTNQSYVA